jgi:hypothetical protein
MILKGLNYDIYGLGFDKYLIREMAQMQLAGSALPLATIMGSGFYDISATTIADGEWDANISLVLGHLQSGNFVTGSTGWKINYNGDVEFNSGVFRGSLIAGSIDIPDKVSANSFHVDTSGNAWWGSTVIGSAVAKVLNTGAATFTNITATGALTTGAGSSINGTYIDSLVANKITSGTGIIVSLDVLNTLTMGSASVNGTIQSYGWNGTVNGFQILGGLTPTINLIGGTITSSSFKTAAINTPRMEINTSGHANAITYVGTGEVYNFSINADDNVFNIGTAGGAGARIELGCNSSYKNLGLITTGDITCYGSYLRPLTNNDCILGSSSYYWQYLYVRGIYLDGSYRSTWPTTTLSGLSIDTSKDWGNYNISNVNTLSCATIQVNGSGAYTAYISGTSYITGLATFGSAIKLYVTSTPPSGAVDGYMFYHDTWDEVWIYKGGAWKALAYAP